MVKGNKANEKKKRNLLNHYNSGNYDTAKKLAKALCKKYPNDNYSWMLLGLILKEYDNMEEALSASQKSIDLSPNDEVAINCYGIVLKHFGKFNEAEKIFNEAIILKPEFAEPYNNLGSILKKLNKKEEEINYFKKAIDLNPNFFLAHKNLGLLFHEANNPKMAMKYYEEANKILNDPEVSHLMSSLSGKAESNFSKDYAKRIFNDQASNFENLLVGKLDYKLPQTVSNLLIEKSQNNSLGSVLDLGCGTGLLGERRRQLVVKVICFQNYVLLINSEKISLIMYILIVLSIRFPFLYAILLCVQKL